MTAHSMDFFPGPILGIQPPQVIHGVHTVAQEVRPLSEGAHTEMAELGFRGRPTEKMVCKT